MSATKNNQFGSNLANESATTTPLLKPKETTSLDPQVKAKKAYSPRRTFDIAYKLSIITAYDACENASARGALLRKEGLYHSRIYLWKKQLSEAKSKSHKNQSSAKQAENLARENDQLKMKLAQAEAIIELQKKVSELFTMHTLPRESSEEKS